MLATLEGLDHVVVMVADLDAAAQQWRALGFTVSPRGVHSAHLGTGNHTMMLDDDYIELLGILTPVEHNAPSREFLARRGDGLERAAFRTSNAAAGARALQERGYAARGPVHFSRPVDLPGGGTGEAAFSVFHWPVDERPADMRIFACQHHTRDMVWLPQLMQHDNTACGIDRIDVVAADPQAAARHMATLIDSQVQAVGGGYQVPTGPGRAGFMFMTKTSFVDQPYINDNINLPEEGAVALVLRARDLDAVRRCAGLQSTTNDDGSVTVPAELASGVTLVFCQA